jgi:hypothetical protein
MYRAITALTLVAALATTAAADPPRARIIQRDSNGQVRNVQPHLLPNPSMQSQFLPFDGPVTHHYRDYFYDGRGSSYDWRDYSSDRRGWRYGGHDDNRTSHPRLQTHVVIVQRPVVEPAATVSRALAQQPVWPDLVEVFMLGEGSGGASTIYLNPDVDYENQGNMRLDRNHFINRAQRTANQLRRRPARVIWGAQHTQPTSAPAVAPAFILERPQPATPQRKHRDDNPKLVRSGD